MTFRVPEPARITLATLPTGMSPRMVSDARRDGNNGYFILTTPEGVRLRCIASDDRYWTRGGFAPPAWEHVSVSVKNRVPTWQEMCFAKAMFWGPEDCVLQFHPAQSEYVNCHPFVLHLWRPIGIDFPRPPSDAVGPK